MSLWEKIKEQWSLYWYGDRSALEELQDAIQVERRRAAETQSTLDRLGAEVRRIKYADGSSITEVEWEEHDMGINWEKGTSTAAIRHDEVKVDSYWEYDVQDGDGDLWGEIYTDHYISEAQILGDLNRYIESTRQATWHDEADFPEPLTIVKRHVRVTTEKTDWSEA